MLSTIVKRLQMVYMELVEFRIQRMRIVRAVLLCVFKQYIEGVLESIYDRRGSTLVLAFRKI